MFTTVLISASLISASSPATPALPATDVQRVYCSLADQRQDLVDTARTLGLRSPPPAFEQWITIFPAEFDKACIALVSARALERNTADPSTTPKISAPAPNYWALLFSALIGALLALLGGEWKSRRDRYFSVAQSLRSAVTAFLKEGNAAVRALRGPMAKLDATAYLAARDALVGRLHEAAALKATPLGSGLVDDLQSGKAERVVQGWSTTEAAARASRSSEATAWLSAIDADVQRLAAAMQKAWPSSPSAITAARLPVGS